MSRGWITHHSLQLSINRRFNSGLSFGFNDTIGLSSRGSTAARLQHNADGTVTPRADQAQADDLFQTPPIRHTMKGNFVWDLPDLRATAACASIGLLANDWQLSGIWTASTAPTYAVGFSYQNGGGNVNLTGSPDYGARVASGRSRQRLLERSVPAVQHGGIPGAAHRQRRTRIGQRLFERVLLPDDGSVDRPQHPSGRGRTLQLRADLFNATNRAGITGRNTTLPLSSPSDPVTNVAPVFDPITGLLNNGVNLTSTGAVSPDRSKPRNAGFGVANAYQAPRNIQLQVRFSF